jgi:hypothetical protein
MLGETAGVLSKEQIGERVGGWCCKHKRGSHKAVVVNLGAYRELHRPY